MSTKERLYRLIDDLPETEIHAAERFLEYLRLAGSDAVLKAVLEAPEDDEPLSDDDQQALRAARDDVAAGRVVSHDEARRRLVDRP